MARLHSRTVARRTREVASLGSPPPQDDLGGHALTRGEGAVADATGRALSVLLPWALAIALAACSPPPSYRGEYVPAAIAPEAPPDAARADPVPLGPADALVLQGDLRLIRADRAVLTPDFDFVDDSGARHTPATLAGRVVRLQFWATWCATCKAEFPDLQRMHEQWEDDGLVVLAVCRNSKPEDFTRAVRKDWISFAAADASDDRGFPFPIGAFPTTVLLDRAGRVRSYWQGWREPKAVEDLVQRLLEEDAAGPTE